MIGGINDIEAHGIAVADLEFFLYALQLSVTIPTDAQGRAGQLQAFLQPLTVQELLGIVGRCSGGTVITIIRRRCRRC